MSESVDTIALLEKATRAPSSHNTQPWLFRARKNMVELHADRTRALPANDPHDRELTISCGATLFNLEAAAAQAGLGTETVLLPEPKNPDHLATVTLGGEPDAARASLACHIDERRTTREAFEDRPISHDLARELTGLVDQSETCWLMLVERCPRREEVAVLVAEGDRAQFASAHWRRELASWMHPRRKGDGLTLPEIVAPVSRVVVRAFDLGKSAARKDQKLVVNAPLIAVLGSARDDAKSWMETGRVLEAILLQAAAHDVQAGYLNQPCQVAELRPRLQDALENPGFPQVVLRFGHAPAASKPSPRRDVQDVLLTDD